MRQLILALCAMGFGFTVAAQTTAPIASPSPAASSDSSAAAPAPATEPLSTTSADNTRYVNDPNLLNDCTARLDAINDKPCDIIFIGDSITARWLTTGKDIWKTAYEPLHALNFGVEGDKVQNVLWRLTNMSIQNLKPKVAVVLIGTNNAVNTSHEIADGIKAVLANTEEAFPGIKIILVSIPPNERDEDKMMQVNSLIKGNADDQSVYFLDLVPLMPGESKLLPNGKIDTHYKGLGPDGINLDASGYQIWSDAMAPVLTKAMSGK